MGGDLAAWRWSAFFALLSLAFYTATLAPTVLWHDGAGLQLMAVKCSLQSSAGGHPIWVWIAHQFTKMPLGDVAGRVNLVSAVFGALTVGLLYLILHELGVRPKASALATLAFAVSHTFWTNAVCAEVYTLTLCFMSLPVWLGLRWYHCQGHIYLAGAGLAFGIGLGIHVMIVLYLPALLWLLWRGRRRLDARAVLAFVLSGGIGALPLISLLVRDVQSMGLRGMDIARWAFLMIEDQDFVRSAFAFSPLLFISDMFEWIAFLGLQFVGLSFVCGIVGIIVGWPRLQRDVSIFVWLLYLAVMAFAFAYRVGDRYVFYLPSYIPFAIWIAFGFQWALERCSSWPLTTGLARWGSIALVVAVVGVPVSTYRLAPYLVSRGLSFRSTWHVPGPKGDLFFLWPSKAGYWDPRVYAETALEAMPPNGLLLSDYILAPPLYFVQEVEGMRPDVTVRHRGWGFDTVLQEARVRPVALADVNPQVYPVEEIRKSFDMVRRGPIYLLVARTPSAATSGD